MAQSGLNLNKKMLGVHYHNFVDWKTRLNAITQSRAASARSWAEVPGRFCGNQPLSILCRHVCVVIEHRQDLLASLGRQREYQALEPEIDQAAKRVVLGRCPEHRQGQLLAARFLLGLTQLPDSCRKIVAGKIDWQPPVAILGDPFKHALGL